MRKLLSLAILGSVLALSIVTPVVAQDAPPIVEPQIPAVATNALSNFQPLNNLFSFLPSWDKDADSFHAGELVIGAAPLWKAFAAAGSTPYASVSGDYFLTEKFGIGGEVITFGDGTGNSAIDTLLINATLRKPVGNIAAFLIAGGGYDLNTEKGIFAIGGGFAYRYRNGIELAFDTRYAFQGTDKNENGLMHRVRLSWAF